MGVLEAVQQSYGPAAPTKILFGIFAQRTEAYRARIKAGTLTERAAAFARLRGEEGYMAEFESGEPSAPEEKPRRDGASDATGSRPAGPVGAPHADRRTLFAH